MAALAPGADVRRCDLGEILEKPGLYLGMGEVPRQIDEFVKSGKKTGGRTLSDEDLIADKDL